MNNRRRMGMEDGMGMRADDPMKISDDDKSMMSGMMDRNSDSVKLKRSGERDSDDLRRSDSREKMISMDDKRRMSTDGMKMRADDPMKMSDDDRSI